MTDLIERYVHQVGRYLPESEREEVQNELRSLLQDQLDDRYKGAPTQDDVIELLAEFGDPRRMAASYGREQYLIGPDLYPVMVKVLQRGWMIIPPIVVLVNVLVPLISGSETGLVSLFLQTAFNVLQAVAIFSAIVIAIFAIMQHSGETIDLPERSFNPRDLPPINDAAAVDRGETVLGIAFGTFWVFILVYFLRAGGLTMRFNPADPGLVLAVPALWLVVAIVAQLFELLMNTLALRRGRWSVALMLTKLVASLVGLVAGYYVFITPLLDWLFETLPFLGTLPFAGSAPEIALALLGFLTLVDMLPKIVKVGMANHRSEPTYKVQTN
jgi:hypothetical protein